MSFPAASFIFLSVENTHIPPSARSSVGHQVREVRESKTGKHPFDPYPSFCVSYEAWKEGERESRGMYTYTEEEEEEEEKKAQALL